MKRRSKSSCVRLERGSDAESEEVFLMKTPDYYKIRSKVLKLQPMRIEIFKRYWDKFKYNKTRREKLVEMFDESEK